MDTPAETEVAAALLARLARELFGMTSVGESLQGLLGRVAEGGRVGDGFLIDAQRLDGLVQHLDELALFLDRLSVEAETGLSDEAIRRAVAPTRLANLADRLATRERPVASQELGECELW